MNQAQREELIALFKKYFPKIGRRETCMWKVKSQTGRKIGFSIECRNGTRNYIIPDSCAIVLHEWNKKNPNFQLKEVARYCIEDDEVWTWIIWDVDFKN